MGTTCSPAVAISIQEGGDGFREKALRIESAQQTDSKGIMDISVKGDLIIWAGRLGIEGRVSLNEETGKLSNYRQLSTAQNIR